MEAGAFTQRRFLLSLPAQPTPWLAISMATAILISQMQKRRKRWCGGARAVAHLASHCRYRHPRPIRWCTLRPQILTMMDGSISQSTAIPSILIVLNSHAEARRRTFTGTWEEESSV